MRLATVAIALVLLPRLAFAEWTFALDTDCRCTRAFPGKVVASTPASPWPKLPWHRSEARVSATEWYAVSWVSFDGQLLASAYADTLAFVTAKGTRVSSAATPGKADITIKRPDGAIVAMRIVSQGRRIYLLEAGGGAPDKLFAGFHAWTDDDATPEGTTAGVSGTSLGDGGVLGGAPPKKKASTVAISKLSGSATIDFDASRALIKQHLGELATCGNGGPGEIKAQLQIGDDGAVSEAHAYGFDHDVAQCIAAKLHKLVFARPPANARPFVDLVLAVTVR